MNRDDLLRELAQMTRDEETAARDGARWEKLARGELTAAEDAELRAEAERDPEAALLYEAYRPLTDDAKGKIAAQVVAGPEEAPPARAADAVPRPAPPRQLFPWRRVAITLVPLAAAAAFAMWVARPSEDRVASVAAPLPDYVLAASGGDRAQRSTEAPSAGPIELRRDSRLELVLRPSTPVSGAVTIRAVLVHGDLARAWDPPMDRSENGAVRIAGVAGELFDVGAGAWDLAFAIGRADAVPADPQAIKSAIGADAGARGWQLLVTRVVLLDGT